MQWRNWGLRGLVAATGVAGVCLGIAACGGGGASSALIGRPLFGDFVGTPPGGSGSGSGGSGGLGTGGRTVVDPCDEPTNRKFVTISMQNLSPDDFVHYFFVAVAFVQSDLYPTGAVCPEDIALYTSNGYTQIADGALTEFGTYCIAGPALVRYHLNGAFRQGAGSNAALASAIGPAQGGNAAFDATFTSAGFDLPVPDLIAFYNPGTGGGATLKVSRNDPNPCDSTVTSADPLCLQDAFYYVDQGDLRVGSTGLGVGSARRVSNDVQGTPCECTGLGNPFQSLAPSGTNAASAQCFEFARGGRIEYAFRRIDETPPVPQLLWRVTDSAGAIWHDFADDGGP